MKFKKFIIEQNGELRDKLFEFFRENPNPPDEDVHALAERLSMDPDDIETAIYGILSSFLANGNFNKSGKIETDVPLDELEMGIEVEFEHTNCPMMAKRIALDHLSEFPDYYTRLAKMEKEAKAALGE